MKLRCCIAAPWLRCLPVSGVLLMAGPAAGGGVTVFSTRAEFDAACPGLPVEDFEETLVPPDDVESCPAPLNENSNDACFQPGDILPGLQINVDGRGFEYAVLGDGFAGNPTVWVGTDLFVDGTALEFSPPVIALGVDVYNPLAPGAVEIELFDNDGILISTHLVPAAAPAFFGVKSLTPIGRAVVAGPTNSGDLVDNVAFGNPNPCSPDLDGDGEVGPADLAQLLGVWGPCADCPQDLTGDDEVSAADLAILLGEWGRC